MSWPLTTKPEISRMEIGAIILCQILFGFLLIMPIERDNDPFAWEYAHALSREVSGTWKDILRAVDRGRFDRVGEGVLILSVYVLSLAGGLLAASQFLWIWLRPAWRVFFWDVLAAFGLIGVGLILVACALFGLPPRDIVWFVLHQTVLYGVIILAALCFGHFGRLLFRSRKPRRELAP